MSSQFGWGKLNIFPLFHPAAVLRGTVPMIEYENSFKKLAQTVSIKNDFGPF